MTEIKNFWKVPNPCYNCEHKLHKIVPATTALTNRVGMSIALCDECVRGFRELDAANGIKPKYRRLNAGEIFVPVLHPTRPQ